MKTCQHTDINCFGIEFDCGAMVEGRTLYCPRHNRLMRKSEETAKRDAEKLAVKLLKQKEKDSLPRKSVKPVSAKQKTKNHEYSERVKVWKVENPICDVQIPGVCTGKTEDCHHSKKRGDLLMVEKYWIPVCRSCHTWIGDNAEEARQRGLTINHLEPEFVEPHKI